MYDDYVHVDLCKFLLQHSREYNIAESKKAQCVYNNSIRDIFMYVDLIIIVECYNM